MDLSNTDYSSKQLISTLDVLLYNSLSPIFKSPYVVNKLAPIVGWYSGPIGRRRISSLDKDALLTKAFNFFMDPTLESYIELQIDRNITDMIIADFIEDTKDYQTALHASIRGVSHGVVSALPLQLGYTGDLYSAINNVKYWYTKYISFKKDLILKNYKFLILQAKGEDQEDMLQTLIVAVNKAISKYDSSKGTLTSYINHWLRDAKGKVYKDRKENRYVSIESFDLDISDEGEGSQEESMMKEEELDRVRLIAKALDPSGVARIHLGITEILTQKELKTLLASRR